MGTMYGVNVWDGSGVRPSAANYDDNGWYSLADSAGGHSPQLPVARVEAFEQILSASLPFTVGDLAGVGEGAGVSMSLLTMLTVGELIDQWVVELDFVLPEAISSTSEVDLSIEVIPSVVPDDRLVPMPVVAYEMPNWMTVLGQAHEITGLVVDAAITPGVGTILREMETYPDPRNEFIPASLRWIPSAGTMTPLATQWAPYSKTVPGDEATSVWELADKSLLSVAEYTVGDLSNSKLIVLPNTRNFMYSSPGVNPTFLPTYRYWRGGEYVRHDALAFRDGAHMWNDTMNWNAEEITVIAVVVLHRPSLGWYGILETSGPGTDVLDPFFGVRYDASGTLVLWADTALASLPVETGETRPAQPVVVGMNIDMAANTCSLLTVDRTVKIQTSALPHRYDNRSRMWVGRSPHGHQASANMELLELGVFDYKMNEGELAWLLGQYDRMYGVSAS